MKHGFFTVQSQSGVGQYRVEVMGGGSTIARITLPVGRVNELLCKTIAYNITVLIHEIFEHGICQTSRT